MGHQIVWFSMFFKNNSGELSMFVGIRLGINKTVFTTQVAIVLARPHSLTRWTIWTRNNNIRTDKTKF